MARQPSWSRHRRTLVGADDLGAGDGRAAGIRMDLQHRSDLPLSGLDQAFKQITIPDNSTPHRVPTMFRDLTHRCMHRVVAQPLQRVRSNQGCATANWPL